MLTVRGRGKRIASSRPVWVTEKVLAIMGYRARPPSHKKEGRERRKGGRGEREREREERREGCHVLSFTDKNESYPSGRGAVLPMRLGDMLWKVLYIRSGSALVSGIHWCGSNSPPWIESTCCVPSFEPDRSEVL